MRRRSIDNVARNSPAQRFGPLPEIDDIASAAAFHLSDKTRCVTGILSPNFCYRGRRKHGLGRLSNGEPIRFQRIVGRGRDMKV